METTSSAEQVRHAWALGIDHDGGGFDQGKESSLVLEWYSSRTPEWKVPIQTIDLDRSQAIFLEHQDSLGRYRCSINSGGVESSAFVGVLVVVGI